MSILVNDLSFGYEKELSILEKASFEISKGQFIGIFGPNGGGKTTLLRLLLGLLTPDEGSIQIDEQKPKKASNQIGYVPQRQHFDKQFPIRVKEVVLQGRLFHHRGWGHFQQKDKEKAAQVLEKVGLSHMANTPFGALSGGQVQRVLIARALASDPKILILDEATSGVDPKALETIYTFLRELKGSVTVLLVTHQLQSMLGEMDFLLYVNHKVAKYTKEQVCGHFAMGLYHPPLDHKEGSDE